MKVEKDHTFGEMVWWYTFPNQTGSATVYIPKGMASYELSLYLEDLHANFENVIAGVRDDYNCIDNKGEIDENS